jgi:outer membrane protein
MKKVFLLSVAMIVFINAYPQKKWSLEECINYAYENNLQIKRQELNVDYNKNNFNQSKFSTLPNLNGQWTHSFSSGKTIDNSKEIPRYVNENYWSGNMGVNSNLNIFSGLTILNDIKQKKYKFLQSQSDLEKTKNDIAMNLTLGYLNILFAKEQVDVAKNKLEVTSLQAERTRKLMEVGNVAQGEYFAIKAQESNDKLALVNQLNALDIAYLDMTQYLDLDSAEGFDIVVPENLEVELLTPPQSVENIYGKALENMPQIRSAELELKSAEKDLAKAWGQVSPSIGINGGLYTYYSALATDPTNPTADYPYGTQMKDYFNKQVGIGITVPLFNRLQVKNSISNAKLGVMNSQLVLDQAKLALYKEIQQAHADARAAMEEYNSSLEAVKSNQEAFKYAQQKLEVGLMNSVDFNVTKNNLITAESALIQSKYKYIFRLKILDFYMGNPIVL